MTALEEYQAQLRLFEETPITAQQVKKIALEIAEALSNDPDFVGLWLYGSHVRGEARNNSDIDICGIFIVDKYGDEHMWETITKIQNKYSKYIDFLYTTEKDFLQSPEYHQNIMREGIYYGSNRHHINS